MISRLVPSCFRLPPLERATLAALQRPIPATLTLLTEHDYRRLERCLRQRRIALQGVAALLGGLYVAGAHWLVSTSSAPEVYTGALLALVATFWFSAQVQDDAWRTNLYALTLLAPVRSEAALLQEVARLVEAVPEASKLYQRLIGRQEPLRLVHLLAMRELRPDAGASLPECSNRLVPVGRLPE